MVRQQKALDGFQREEVNIPVCHSSLTGVPFRNRKVY